MKNEISPSCPECGVWEGAEHSDTCPVVFAATLKRIEDKIGSSKAVERIKEWVVQHHSHHVGCNKKGSAGCQDKDSPYVNSLALMDFLEELSG